VKIGGSVRYQITVTVQLAGVTRLTLVCRALLLTSTRGFPNPPSLLQKHGFATGCYFAFYFPAIQSLEDLSRKILTYFYYWYTLNCLNGLLCLFLDLSYRARCRRAVAFISRLKQIKETTKLNDINCPSLCLACLAADPLSCCLSSQGEGR